MSEAIRTHGDGTSERTDGPLVTIIIPTYNRAGLVEQAIDSVLEQDYDRLEVLVLDDGSVDDTPSILAEYAERHGDRFRWARHENMGQAKTLNRGFDMARGELVGYLSSDDLFLPSAISKLAAALAADPEAVLAYPAFHVVDESGTLLRTMVPPEYSAAESLRLHDCIVNVGAIYRRSVTDRIGGWDPGFIYQADLDFYIRASALGGFRLLSEPLACWRAHPGSANAAPGLRGAREQTLLLDKVYAAEEVPDELDKVRDEAYRNAYFVAAYAMGGVNTAGERFFVHDSHAREVSAGTANEETLMIARLRRRVAALERRERWLTQALERTTDGAAGENGAGRRHNPLREPLWWRALRRVVPSRVRPRGRQLLDRFAGDRVPPPGAIVQPREPGRDPEASTSAKT